MATKRIGPTIDEVKTVVIREAHMTDLNSNMAARAMYRKMGYKEIGIVPTTFNGTAGVDLVLLEKTYTLKQYHRTRLLC